MRGNENQTMKCLCIIYGNVTGGINQTWRKRGKSIDAVHAYFLISYNNLMEFGSRENRPSAKCFPAFSTHATFVSIRERIHLCAVACCFSPATRQFASVCL
jgi:hypothetical protein